MDGKSEKPPGEHGEEEWVLTPGGWRPKSKVRHVPPGCHVSAEGGRLRIIRTATGEVVEDLGEVSETGPPPMRRAGPMSARQDQDECGDDGE